MGKRDKLRELLGKGRGSSVSALFIPHSTSVHNVPDKPIAVSTTAQVTVNTTPVATNTTPGSRALQLAIERHLNVLPEADKEAFRQASKQITNENLLSQVKAYDEDHKRVSQFRPHAEALSRFLGLLDRFMAGVAIGIQANPDISSIAVGAVRIVINLALSFVTFFARFSEMLSRFSDFLTPLTQYAEASTKAELIQESLANVYMDLLQFCDRARHVFIDQKGLKRSWTSWRLFWRLQWVPFEEEFGKIESDMQHHLDVLRHSAQASDLNATLDASRSEKSSTGERKRSVASRLEKRCHRKGPYAYEVIVEDRESFLSWISNIPFEKIHEAMYTKKHPGTGDWLLQTPQFQDWFDSSGSSLLWCYGKREYYDHSRLLEADGQ
jgi:hypothetical protein